MKINSHILPLLLSLGLTILLSACSKDGTLDLIATGTPVPTKIWQPTKVEVESTLGESDPLETLIPTSPQRLDILQTTIVLDSLGNAVLVGLIRNNSDRVVKNILVEVEIFDADRIILLSEKIPTLLSTLAPGESSPFLFRAFKDLPGVDQIVSKLFDHEIGDVERGEVEIHGVIVEVDDHNALHITGELYNGSFDPITINGLAASVSDAEGIIIAADLQSASSQYLEPGENGPFRVTILGLNSADLKFLIPEIYIDAEVVPPQSFFDLTISDPYAYMEDPGSFHLVGEITNNSQDAINVCLIAGIYDSNDSVLDASTTNLPISSLNPGETLPYDFDLWGPMSFKNTILANAARFSVQWEPCKKTVNNNNYVDLEIQLEKQHFDPDQGTFSGNIINNSGFDVSSAAVIVSIRDNKTGAVVAMEYKNIHEEILDGGTTQFEIMVNIPRNIDIADIEIEILTKGELSD